jgi:hypothetical protein
VRGGPWWGAAGYLRPARVMPSAGHRPRCHGSRIILPVEDGGDVLGVQAVEMQVQLTAGGGKCGRASPRLCERLGGPRQLRGAGGIGSREGTWRGPRLLASAAGACEQAPEAGGTCTYGNPAGNHPAATGSPAGCSTPPCAGLPAGGSGVPREPHQEGPGALIPSLHAPRRCPGESTQTQPAGVEAGCRPCGVHVEACYRRCGTGRGTSRDRGGQPPGWAAYTSSSHSRP